MGIVVFECQKCGYCCQHLIEKINGIINGLFLTNKETKLFPRELISPQKAIGVERPKRIISYQLNIDTCPHINERNECKIYDKRPLACRAFPYEIVGHKPTVSVKCPVIGNQMAEGEKRVVDLAAVEIQASWKINSYLQNRYRRYLKRKAHLWEYDLKTRKWSKE